MTPAWHDVDVVFRCDAGAVHGLGHLSRCLTVADACRHAGWRPGFVVHAPDELSRRVTTAGWPLYPAGGPVGSAADDPDAWMPHGARVVVVDSKAATAAWLLSCGRHRRVVCFDDEEARDLPCDVVVNNHVWARVGDYGDRPGRRLLLGPAFNTVNAAYFQRASAGHGLLITLGGEDPHNHSAWLVETLADLVSDMPVTVCIGPAHPAPYALRAVCAQRVPHADVLRAPSSLVAAAQRSHLALSAAGTTCYELAAAGIPFGVLAVEDHQDRMADAMVQAGVALRLGRFDDLDAASVRAAFARLQDDAVAAQLRDAGRRLMRGPGAPAIVAAWQEWKDTR